MFARVCFLSWPQDSIDADSTFNFPILLKAQKIGEKLDSIELRNIKQLVWDLERYALKRIELHKCYAELLTLSPLQFEQISELDLSFVGSMLVKAGTWYLCHLASTRFILDRYL